MLQVAQREYEGRGASQECVHTDSKAGGKSVSVSNSSAAFHAIDMVPRRGRKFTGHSFVGYHVDCTWGFAMTLKQSFCVSNI